MVSEQTELKYAKELRDQYKDLYIKHYGKAPLFNTHRDLWGFRRMAGDFEKKQCVEIVDYYFAFKDKYNHNYSELFNNYDRFYADLTESRELAEKDKEARLETQRAVKEWRQKNAQRTGTTD